MICANIAVAPNDATLAPGPKLGNGRGPYPNVANREICVGSEMYNSFERGAQHTNFLNKPTIIIKLVPLALNRSIEI